jgi:hypothetical protein
MEVTNLRDPHAAECIWKTEEADNMLFDIQFVARDFAHIERNAAHGGGRKREKRPAREAVRR